MCTPPSSTGHLANMSLPSSTMERSWGEKDPPVPKRLLSLPGQSFLSQRLLRLRSFRSHLMPSRRKREMTPASKKDNMYWDKRRKNNEAAKRSREKRRINDLMLEGQLLALSKENAQLRAEVVSLQCHLTHPFPSPSTATAATIHCHAPAHGYPNTSQLQSALWGFKSNCLPMLEGPRGRAAALSQSPLSVNQRSQDGRVFSGSSPLSPSVVHHPQHRASCVPSQALSEFLLKPANLSESSAEAVSEPDKAAHHHVSSSNDIPTREQRAPIQKVFQPPAQAIPAHFPTSSTHSSPSWLLPRLGQSSLHDSLLVPWSSTSFYPSSLYPSLPLSLYLPLADPELLSTAYTCRGISQENLAHFRLS